MNIKHYTYRVRWSPEDNEHVGSCVEFPSISWLAKTPEAALRGVLAGWGRYLLRRHPHPILPPQLRGKEPDRLPISVIAVEKLPIGRLSKCHSTLTP